MLYCDAGAVRQAAKLADKRAQQMYQQGRWRTLESWAERIQAPQSMAPRLYLYLATYYGEQGKFSEAEAALATARSMCSTRTPKPVRAHLDIVGAHLALRQGRMDALEMAVERAEELLAPRGSRHRKADCFRLRSHAAMQRGQPEAAVEFARQAVKLLERTSARYALATAMIDLSNRLSACGQAQEAHAFALRAHEAFMEIGAPLPLAASFNNLAFDAHLLGNYEEALNLFNEGLKYARQAASPAREANILLGQADLFADLNLALQAAELYGEGLNNAIQLDDDRLIHYGCVQTSVLHRRRGGSALSHEWLKRSLAVYSSSEKPPISTIQLAALEIKANPAHARESLRKLLEGSAQLDAMETMLALYFDARASLSAGELDQAGDGLTQAFDWASTNGMVQILAAELRFDSEFLEFTRSRMRSHPLLPIILRRMETMRAVAEHYRDVTDDRYAGKRTQFIALGEAAVMQDEQLLTELKPLAREVLFYLIDHHRVDRDVLLETFWPHHPPGRQVANLHTAVYSLRRLLGRDSILHEGSVYEFNPDYPLDYDVERFERAASIAEGLPPGDPRSMFALTEAINLYTGGFLPEFSSDWVLERRRALEIHYLELLAHHAQEALVRDQPLRAVNTLRQALQIDPYRDDTNMRFLEALGRLGRRSEVVAHYQRYVRLLSEELGLDPPEQVRELYARLIR
jgi:DNA-binding SARP family transcriptional activator/tetratricopeptide (TPR) repeat protein